METTVCRKCTEHSIDVRCALCSELTQLKAYVWVSDSIIMQRSFPTQIWKQMSSPRFTVQSKSCLETSQQQLSAIRQQQIFTRTSMKKHDNQKGLICWYELLSSHLSLLDRTTKNQLTGSWQPWRKRNAHKQYSMQHGLPSPDTTTTKCHYHHHNHHQLSLSSSQPPISVTIIITATTTCHYHQNHHHLSLSLSSEPPPSVTIIITTTTMCHYNHHNHHHPERLSISNS